MFPVLHCLKKKCWCCCCFCNPQIDFPTFQSKLCAQLYHLAIAVECIVLNIKYYLFLSRMPKKKQTSFSWFLFEKNATKCKYDAKKVTESGCHVFFIKLFCQRRRSRIWQFMESCWYVEHGFSLNLNRAKRRLETT